MICKNCEKEIRLISEAGPWVHVEGSAVECHEVTEAEPEGKDE